MNKKILGLIAASVAVVGTAFSAAPAKANVEQQVEVEVNVAPALFLRTFDKVEINVTANGTAASKNTVAGGPVEGLTAEELTEGGPGSLSSVNEITKEIPTLYAVWGNEGTVDVTVEPTAGDDILDLQGTALTGLANAAQITGATAILPANNTLDPDVAVVGGATVDIAFGRKNSAGTFTAGSNASAGKYTGASITVRAVQQ